MATGIRSKAAFLLVLGAPAVAANGAQAGQAQASIAVAPLQVHGNGWASAPPAAGEVAAELLVSEVVTSRRFRVAARRVGRGRGIQQFVGGLPRLAARRCPARRRPGGHAAVARRVGSAVKATAGVAFLSASCGSHVALVEPDGRETAGTPTRIDEGDFVVTTAGSARGLADASRRCWRPTAARAASITAAIPARGRP